MGSNKVVMHAVGTTDACEACGSKAGTDFIQPYTIESNTINRSRSTYEFFHHPAYCGSCGHIWNKTPPTSKVLDNYYRDQLAHFVEDYDPAKRVEVIKKILAEKSQPRLNLAGLHVLDYGSNSRLAFHEQLENHGALVSRLDIGDDEFDKTTTLNVITCYFMLEHSINPKQHFDFFASALDSEGILIIEVPDTRMYNMDCTGLLYEHQQHFQPSSMDELAKRLGFVNIYTAIEDCSRSFGFLAAYQKQDSDMQSTKPQDTRSAYVAAREMQLHIDKLIDEAAEKVLSIKKIEECTDVFFWGINDLYVRIREKLSIAINKSNDHTFFGIDLNPTKKQYLIGRDSFLSPGEAQALFDQGTGCPLLFITASAHWKRIIPSINFKGRIIAFDPFDKESPFREFTYSNQS